MNNRKAAFVLWLVMLLSLGFGACKPTVPSEFISKKEMEQLLYDYHMADAMARLQPDNYKKNIIAYRAAVLKKHGVSEAEFDTSMVYYMRHTSELHEIYKHIAERMEIQARELGSTVGGLTAIGGYSASGDTVDIWKDMRSVALIADAPYNYLSFAYKADSSFKKGDSFIMTMNSDFVFQDGMRDGIATLALVFTNDSVASRVIHISSSTQLTLNVDNRDTLGIKEVRGYFMLNRGPQNAKNSTTLHLMTLSNIRLYRCHMSKKPKPKAGPDKMNIDDSLRRSRAGLRRATMPDNIEDSANSRQPL